MSSTLYKKVDYSLKALIEDLSLGEIALPDLQRPFVWPNSNVRDLFDSMYRGYPVGYLLFWATDKASNKVRSIGTDAKQKEPGRLVVDGQQRLTALYAVMKGMQVVRDALHSETIQIAFCPRNQKFEVLDAAVANDPEFISDISRVWAKGTMKAGFVRDFIAKLRTVKEVSEDEGDQIASSIDRLFAIEDAPFYVLELSSSMDEEQVAEVFVRINSQGKKLNQADFILTLMSVFWDEGRRSLENFCLETHKPTNDHVSPYNHISRPGPDNLLRVTIGLGFSRGRLKHAYSVLRGKDLDTGLISVDRRHEQFEILKLAQRDVLDLTNWHEFLKVPMSAGFVTADMITSQVGLLFCYTLYLIGHRDFMMDRSQLRTMCARWLFMSALTGRYTGSPESVIERDIVEIRAAKSADELLKSLNRTIDATLTEDFWNVTLPTDLTTSSASSPSLRAYQAALCNLNAKALFSNLYLRDLFNPSVRGTRSNVERHHLFPKNYLRSLGLTSVRETNQIANYAWLEWTDNGAVSDAAPADYMPKFLRTFDPAAQKDMFYWHALPEKWWKMEYDAFLVARRKLIAQVIRDGFLQIDLKRRRDIAS